MDGNILQYNGFNNKVIAKWPTWYFYILVFLASILVTSLFFTVLPESWSVNESSDFFNTYEPLARNILAGKGPTRTGKNIETLVPPGYPLILAVEFSIAKILSIPDSAILTVSSVFFAALSVIFLFDLARRFSNTKSALIVALVWMSYPFFLWLTKQPNSELPFMAFLFGGCDLFFSLCYYPNQKKFFLFIPAGIIIGVAMLIRPIALLYPIAMVLAILFKKHDRSIKDKLITSGLFILGILIIVLPWELYVYSNTGKIILLASNREGDISGGLVYALGDDKFRSEIPIPNDVEQLMLDIKDDQSKLTSMPNTISYLWDQLIETPVPVVKLFALKALRSWYATDSHRLENYIIVVQIPYMLLILLSIWSAFKMGGKAKSLLGGISLLVITNWIMVIGAFSILRYMVPIIGLLFVNLAQIPLSFKKSHNVIAEQDSTAS